MNNRKKFYIVYELLESLLSSESKFKKGDYIMWTTPAATEMRFGFEVTMYVMNK
jgi:pyrroloquinoline quinone biosynthesis protein A